MVAIRSEDGKKWINAFIAAVSGVSGFIVIRFAQQLGEWFDLEASVPHFEVLTQIIGAIVGVITFIIVFKNKKSSQYLGEVFGELVKVVWPDRDAIVKLTVGIIIAVSIVSGILVLVDYLFRQLLALIY